MVRLLTARWGFFAEERVHTACLMSMWHVMAMLYRSIWLRHVNTFFAPLFLALYPTSTCNSTPKLPSIQAFCSDLEAAYSLLRLGFLPIYAANPHNVTLKSFQQLFEFFLPLVCYPFLFVLCFLY